MADQPARSQPAAKSPEAASSLMTVKDRGIIELGGLVVGGQGFGGRPSVNSAEAFPGGMCLVVQYLHVLSKLRESFTQPPGQILSCEENEDHRKEQDQLPSIEDRKHRHHRANVTEAHRKTRQTQNDMGGFSTQSLLGIYSGTDVNNLTLIGSDDNSAGDRKSHVNFNAVAGTNYRIAVDGFSGATGNVGLRWITVPSDPIHLALNAQRELTLTAPLGTYQLQASTNLGSWITIDTLTINSSPGRSRDTDNTWQYRFYRVVRQP